MKLQPVNQLLQRELDEPLNSILLKLSISLDDIVNLGTHFIKIDTRISRRGMDNHTPTIFLRNTLELADSISILMKNSSIEPAKILFRSLLENSSALLFMIEDNEKIRSHCFAVWKTHEDLKFYKKMVSSEMSSKELVKKIRVQYPNFELDDIRDINEVLEVIKAKEELLSFPIYAEVNEEYFRCKAKGKTFIQNWYSLYDGPKDFNALCTKLNASYNYEFQYRKFSENSHGINAFKGFIESGENRADIRQLRDYKDCRDVYFATVDILIKLLTQYVEKRVPAEKTMFNNWLVSYSDEYNETDKKTEFTYNG